MDQDTDLEFNDTSKAMKASPETGSLRQQQATDPTKPCDTCCDLNPLCPVESSTKRKVQIFKSGTRYISVCQTLGDYKTSAELGCPICRLIAEVIDHFWPGRTRDAEASVAMKENDVPIVWTTHWPGVYIYTRKTPGEKRSLPQIPAIPEISPSNSSSEAFDFLHRHLAECTKEHKLCTAANTSGMPKRLIRIDNAHHAFLVEATDKSKYDNATYAALSYCWGGNQKFKAERSNLPLLMEQGFLIASLPVVWRETIGICRKLGLLYLWIDALCIIQDDEADWAAESARMGIIYENAYLTIAAASSGSVDATYLSSTPDQNRKPKEFTVLPATSGYPATTVFARHHPRNWHFHGRDVYKMNKDPWRLRGWTMQEEIMSRRLIVFGAEEMQWRCKTTMACECAQDTYVYDTWPYQFSEDDGQSSRETREDDMYRYWRNSVIRRYGPRQSTYPQDIFSALSGIAQRVARATGWTYVAGMWKEYLIFEMCWQNDVLEGLEPFHRVYVAPTFSWASVNGYRMIHRFLHHYKFTPDAAVIDVDIKLKYAGAPFSTVVDGCVVLRGRLAQATLEYADGEYCVVLDTSTQGQDGSTSREEFQLRPDTHIQAVPVATSSPEGHQEKVLWTGTRASNAPIGPHTARLGAPPESGGCVVWMLLLGTVWRYMGDDAQCVLVLGKSVRRPGAYERLGLVSNQDDKTGPQLMPMKSCGRTETLTIV